MAPPVLRLHPTLPGLETEDGEGWLDPSIMSSTGTGKPVDPRAEVKSLAI